MLTQPLSLESFQTFGELLKYFRRRERLTQLELSIAVGYSETQIGRLEQNQRKPDLTAVKALFIPALHLEDEPELAQRLVELAQSARQEDAPAPGIAPYKGLLFFDEFDADLFFGREALTAHLAERITGLVMDASTRCLAVIGASGSGKSSLVRAGLAVTLKRAGWDVRVFTPTAHPLKMLAANLNALHAKYSKQALLVVDQQPLLLRAVVRQQRHRPRQEHQGQSRAKGRECIQGQRHPTRRHQAQRQRDQEQRRLQDGGLPLRAAQLRHQGEVAEADPVIERDQVHREGRHPHDPRQAVPHESTFEFRRCFDRHASLTH